MSKDVSPSPVKRSIYSMTIETFEQTYNVKLIRKDKSPLMKLAGWFLEKIGVMTYEKFMTRYWTTYRLPFQVPKIAYAISNDPMDPWLSWLRKHELVHAEDIRSTFGLLRTIVRLTYPEGRWLIEKDAYLEDINAHAKTPQQAAEQLWNNYGQPKPIEEMVAYFVAHKDS